MLWTNKWMLNLSQLWTTDRYLWWLNQTLWNEKEKYKNVKRKISDNYWDLLLLLLLLYEIESQNEIEWMADWVRGWGGEGVERAYRSIDRNRKWKRAKMGMNSRITQKVFICYVVYVYTIQHITYTYIRINIRENYGKSLI